MNEDISKAMSSRYPFRNPRHPTNGTAGVADDGLNGRGISGSKWVDDEAPRRAKISAISPEEEAIGRYVAYRSQTGIPSAWSVMYNQARFACSVLGCDEESMFLGVNGDTQSPTAERFSRQS